MFNISTRDTGQKLDFPIKVSSANVTKSVKTLVKECCRNEHHGKSKFLKKRTDTNKMQFIFSVKVLKRFGIPFCH